MCFDGKFLNYKTRNIEYRKTGNEMKLLQGVIFVIFAAVSGKSRKNLKNLIK